MISNNALIVVPGNDLRKEINNYFVKDHAKSKGKKILVCRAIDICKNGKFSFEQTTMTRKLPNTQTGGLPSELPLFEGMSVYLTKNISTEIGLTNGTTGIVKQIICQRSEKTMSSEDQTLHKLPQYVIIEFPNVSLTALSGLPTMFQYSLWMAVSPSKQLHLRIKHAQYHVSNYHWSQRIPVPLIKAKGKHYKKLLSTLSLPRE